MNKIPNHIAIIMDGNGRWATQRGLPRSAGHLEGSKTLKKLALYMFEKGVKTLSVFAFSTENFKRDQEEVDYLMNLFIKMFNKEFKIFNDKNIKVIFSGRKENLKPEVIASLEKTTNDTKNNTGGIFNVCLNYGGREEIIDAAKKISKLDNIDNLDTETFSKYLYNDLDPIDLVIRTSGEYRISNFMLYQMAYAELYFTNTYFPALTTKELNTIIESYNNRDRRFGGNHK